MEFITIKPRKSDINRLNREAFKSCTHVDAAVAYITDDSTLISGAAKANIPLNLYARYDYSEPVKIHILRQFIAGKYTGLNMRLVADIFHPKVIWWRKYGAYIGSANLTQKAWFENFEAGVFLTEEELYDDGGIAGELEDFFESVKDHSHALTKEIVDKIAEFNQDDFLREDKKLRDQFNEKRNILKLSGFHDVKRRNGSERRKAAFIKEWDETLQLMRRIGDLASKDESRPNWVCPETPSGVQADQFLHAYYYNKVAEGNAHPFNEFYQQNKNRTEQALDETLKWWKNLPGALANEDVHMDEWAPFIRDHFSKEKLLHLSADEFYEACFRLHALSGHALRIAWAHHGKIVPHGLNKSERVKILSDWLLEQKNKKGEGPLEVIYYVLYGGEDAYIAKRIFEASFDEKRKIPHLSVSTYGEIVGWALADKFPPRNGRTSKALTALGYDVAIHSQ